MVIGNDAQTAAEHAWDVAIGAGTNLYPAGFWYTYKKRKNSGRRLYNKQIECSKIKRRLYKKNMEIKVTVMKCLFIKLKKVGLIITLIAFH